MNRHARAHCEALANVGIGIVVSQAILWFFGMPLSQAVALNAVMILASYLRAFVLRLLFARWTDRQGCARHLTKERLGRITSAEEQIEG